MSDSTADEAVVVFTHLPKTGGMTLQRVLSQRYTGDALYAVPMALPQVQPALDTLRQLPAAQRRRVDCVIGHVPFGVHEWFERPVHYVALVRDPVDRFLSEYSYVRDNPILRRELGMDPAATAELSAYIDAAAACGFTNLQTRFLCGGPELADSILPPYGELPADSGARACAHIDSHYCVAGTTRQFDASLLLLARELDWPRAPCYIRRNETRNRLRQGDVAASLLTRIEEVNAMDRQLYEHVAERQTTRLAAAGDAFTTAVAHYQRRNARHQAIDRLLLSVPRRIRQRLRRAAAAPSVNPQQ
jgi:hypothetical protein